MSGGLPAMASRHRPRAAPSTVEASRDAPVSGSQYQLKCGKLELNDIEVVQRLIRALAEIIIGAKAWHRLEVYKGCYFQTPDQPLPIDPGWYVICDGQRTPLYVGQGNNLHSRLNPGSGSLDNFAHSRRDSDAERNFIKALRTMGYIPVLYVAIAREPDLLHRIGVLGPLDKVDRGNVERRCSGCTDT